ncbi:MAG TPA: glycosyltransferase, partial [Acidobacteriota bacterium]|nr:glycosyltransferase [Acidobacteriota bacterium]
MTYPQLELSVLIATRNRARLLGPTLASLARQEMNGLRWEVIVIDNNSTDDTPQIVEQARRTLPLVLLFESEP